MTTSRHEGDVDVHRTSIPRTIAGQATRADARTGVRQRRGDGAATIARLGAARGEARRRNETGQKGAYDNGKYTVYSSTTFEWMDEVQDGAEENPKTSVVV